MNGELIAYLKKAADDRESYLLLDDSLRLAGHNLLSESLRANLSIGTSFRPYVSAEDFSVCESFFRETDGADVPGAVFRLSALSDFTYGYAIPVSFFSKRYLILYLFPDRLMLQRSRVFSAPLADLLSRIGEQHKSRRQGKQAVPDFCRGQIFHQLTSTK